MIFQKLCQRDPRWAHIRIGASNATLGQEGCLVDCYAMASQWFGHYLSPPEIAVHKEWFNSLGEMLIDKVNIPGMKLKYRLFGENDPAISKSIVSPPEIVILKVNNGKHFILATHTVNGDFLCDDPWTGNVCLAKHTYKNIVASIHLTKA